MEFSQITARAAADGAIGREEILELRRAGWASGSITPEEADAIFTLNDTLTSRPDAWVDFFVEAVGEYALNTMEPRGFVTDENAEWLIARLDHDGRLESMAELELLVRLVERAKNVPERLKSYVLDAVESAVLSGTGPTRDGGELSDTYVTTAEAKIMRRAIFAPASDRPAAVSRREAEMLFRIKDACLGADNNSEWKRLFVQGVGNYLQGFSARNGQISRERAAELDDFMKDSESNVGRFVGRMVKAVPNVHGIVFGKKKADATPDRFEQVDTAAAVTDSEREWLDAKVAANGEVDEFDRALLDFLAEV